MRAAVAETEDCLCASVHVLCLAVVLYEHEPNKNVICWIDDDDEQEKYNKRIGSKHIENT